MQFDLAPFGLALFGGIVGGLAGAFFSHVFTASRDRANKARENAVVHLISAFRTFSKANGRAHLYDIGDELSQAIGDIHLFGRQEEIRLVQKFVADMRSSKEADLDPLLAALRSNYRDEVGLPPVGGEIHWLRVVDPDSPDAEHMRKRDGAERG